MIKKVLIIFIIVIIALGLVFIIKNNDDMYCTDETHRDAYPVNPYCKKCRGIDGIVQHECTNPNGKDKYCALCGKIVKDWENNNKRVYTQKSK